MKGGGVTACGGGGGGVHGWSQGRASWFRLRHCTANDILIRNDLTRNTGGVRWCLGPTVTVTVQCYCCAFFPPPEMPWFRGSPPSKAVQVVFFGDLSAVIFFSTVIGVGGIFLTLLHASYRTAMLDSGTTADPITVDARPRGGIRGLLPGTEARAPPPLAPTGCPTALTSSHPSPGPVPSKPPRCTDESGAMRAWRVRIIPLVDDPLVMFPCVPFRVSCFFSSSNRILCQSFY